MSSFHRRRPRLPDGSYRHVSRQRTTTGIAVLCDLCVPLRRNDRLDPSLRQRFVNLPLVVGAVAVESIDFARRLIQQVVHLTAIVATVRLVITAKTYTAKYRDGNRSCTGSGDRLPRRKTAARADALLIL